MGIERREYKMMLDHREFRDDGAMADLWTDVLAIAKALNIEAGGKLKKDKVQDVAFLDTPDHTIRANELVLRRRERQDKQRVQLTLKRRSPDRFVAEGAVLTTNEQIGDDRKRKIEEDITAPFRSRYSHSATVTFKDRSKVPKIKSLKDAADVFPGLAELRRDGRGSDPNTKLGRVNELQVRETVYATDELHIGPGTEAALLLWRRHPHFRLVVAEFSFRYEHDEKKKSIEVAQTAKDFFEAIQRLPWTDADARTKTQFADGDDASG